MSDKLTIKQVLETPGVETVRPDAYMYHEDSDEVFYGDGTNFIMRVVKLPNGDFYALCDVPISSPEDLEAIDAIGPCVTESKAAVTFRFAYGS